MLQLLSFVAENERVNIRQRQAEGIAAAKKRGVKFGRPSKEMPDNFPELVDKWNKKEVTIKEITSEFHMSEATIYRRLRELRASKRMRK